MSSWFVFFVQTGKERVICNYLNEMIGDEETVAFIPLIELIYKNSRQVRKELKPMFPGYILAESVIDERKFVSKVSQITRRTAHFINLLGKENPDCMALHDNEKELLGFCDDKHIVQESIGFIEGDKVTVTSGPLRGRESIINRLDRHRRRAEVELEFMGDVRRISVSLEVVEKIK